MTELIDRIRSIGNDYVLVCKTANGDDCGDGKRGILKPDGTPLLIYDEYTAQTTQFVEIIDVGPACKWFKPEYAQWHNDKWSGEITFSPEMGDGMHWIEGPYWVIKEAMLLPVLFMEAGPKAIGHYIILEVPHEKTKDTAKVITPDVIRDVQHFGNVVSVGDLVVEPLQVGQRVLVPKELFTFETNGKHYACIAEDVVLGIEEDSAASHAGDAE